MPAKKKSTIHPSKELPHYNFCKAVVAGKGGGHQYAVDSLKTHNLHFTEDHYRTIYNELSTENPEYFDPKADPQKTIQDLEADHMDQWNITKMCGYLYDINVSTGVVGIEGAFKILDDPLMFRLISSLAIIGITEEDIELMVNGKFNAQYSTEDIKDILYYCFNMKSWTRMQRVEYVKNYGRPECMSAYKIAIKGDKDYLIWKLGAAPDKTYDAMLKEMMVDSFYNFKEKVKSDPDLAQRWGNLTVKLTDKLDKIHKENVDSRDMFQMIEFITDQDESEGSPPHIEDIEKWQGRLKDPPKRGRPKKKEA